MSKFCCLSACVSSDCLEAYCRRKPDYICSHFTSIPEGYAFIISGIIGANRDRFVIDFISGNDNQDIILRLTVKASTNTLSRNARVNNEWGAEDSSVINPFRIVKCKEFEIQVLFIRESIFFAFNGLHVAKSAHRTIFSDMSTVEIRGKIEDLYIENLSLTHYPRRYMDIKNVSRLRYCYAQSGNVEDIESEMGTPKFTDQEKQFLPLPYYSIFGEGFFIQGYSLTVMGKVSPAASMIKVALQLGQHIWPQPAVAMQLEFNFKQNDKPVIALSSFTDGRWNHEANIELETGLRPGDNFNLRIVHGETTYDIILNNKHLHYYSYPIDSVKVDTCFIEGNIELVDVFIEN